MNDDDFFAQAFVYLAAAVVSVPIAKRLALGSVLGYLIAGIVIGPSLFGLVGQEGEHVMHFAEFGVVMMLFLVGLELEPERLWHLRVPILGLGGVQVVGTSTVIAVACLVAGLPFAASIALGMIFSLSSTAIVLQTLEEKGLLKTGGGRSSFAVLLFQDIAVIPMLAVFPLMGTSAGVGAEDSGWIATLPGWGQMLVLMSAIALIVIGGRFAVGPAFRWIARTQLREIFVAAALLLVIAIALLMTEVGLSPALGTFLAGVVLANSEYRHELESDIQPFKGLLLGLFFIAVGAAIDFRLVAENPGTVLGLVVLLMLTKFAFLFGIGRLFKLSVDQCLLFAFALAQGGEFAFVLLTFSERIGVMASTTTALAMAIVALSMAATPLAMLAFERVRLRVGARDRTERAFDDVDHKSPVIIAGYGRFGQIVARLLETQGIHATVLEYDSDQVELLRRFGRRVFYGDASRYDLLEAAGAREAKLLVLALDQPEKIVEMVQTVRRHFPHLQIISRAAGRLDAYDLIEAGVEHVFRETFDSALRAGTTALEVLGIRAHRAHRAAQRFRRDDEAQIRESAFLRRAENFVSIVRERNEENARILAKASQPQTGARDNAWDNVTLREERLSILEDETQAADNGDSSKTPAE